MSPVLEFYMALFGFDDATVIFLGLLVLVFAWIVGGWKLKHQRPGAEKRV